MDVIANSDLWCNLNSMNSGAALQLSDRLEVDLAVWNIANSLDTSVKMMSVFI